jgi:hypothetical protein
MIDIIVVVAATVSVLTLIASIVVAVVGSSTKRALRDQEDALRSAAAAEEAADRLLRSLQAVNSDEVAAARWHHHVGARPVFAFFSDAILIEEREAERGLPAYWEIEKSSSAPLWARAVERKTKPPAPWWANQGRASSQADDDDDSWNSTGALPQLA